MIVVHQSKFWRGLATAALSLTLLSSATLEKLSMDDLVARSTTIVRAKVTGAAPLVRGAVIYTEYSLATLETLKGTSQAQLTVASPGGKSGRLQQLFPGAPMLRVGQEYVLFLWAGKSGMNQIMGLTQGLFTLNPGSDGQQVAVRAAADATMLDPASGKAVADVPLSLGLNDLRTEINRRLGPATR